jgi:hypothetical protein
MPQLVPSAAVLQADVLVSGWQVWHAVIVVAGVAGFGAPDA